MSDDKATPPEIDIQQVVEALLNICGQAAEMQIDEDSRLAIYDMCDAVAEHHGVQTGLIVSGCILVFTTLILIGPLKAIRSIDTGYRRDAASV